MAFCWQCGLLLAAGWRFCVDCGSRVPDDGRERSRRRRRGSVPLGESDKGARRRRRRSDSSDHRLSPAPDSARGNKPNGPSAAVAGTAAAAAGQERPPAGRPASPVQLPPWPPAPAAAEVSSAGAAKAATEAEVPRPRAPGSVAEVESRSKGEPLHCRFRDINRKNERIQEDTQNNQKSRRRQGPVVASRAPVHATGGGRHGGAGRPRRRRQRRATLTRARHAAGRSDWSSDADEPS